MHLRLAKSEISFEQISQNLCAFGILTGSSHPIFQRQVTHFFFILNALNYCYFFLDANVFNSPLTRYIHKIPGV